jgi:hypothetical protein
MDKPQSEVSSLPPINGGCHLRTVRVILPVRVGEIVWDVDLAACRLPNCVLQAILIPPSEVLVSMPTAYLLRSLKASSAAFFRACTLNSGEFYSLFTR